MNAILRHIAVRLWLAAFGGGLLSLLWLPFWHHIFGIEGVWLPALGTLAAAFGGVGFLMNRLGRLLLQRQIREAAVWERAGMDRQARAAYDRVAALYDSFWMSPLQRHRYDRLAAGHVMRYYLAQAELTAAGRHILAAYFQRNPDDGGAAERWLEHLLEYEHHTHAEHEAVTRVGDRLIRHLRIQHLILRFHLATERTDFSALQVYRRLWHEDQEFTSDLVVRLARLLLGESLINNWALSVYLKAHAAGSKESLEGIRAAVRMLRPDSSNRADLEQARKLCAVEDGKPLQHQAPFSVVSSAGSFTGIPAISVPEDRSQDPEPTYPKALESEMVPIEDEPQWRFQGGPSDFDLDNAADPQDTTVKRSGDALNKARWQSYGRAGVGLIRALVANCRHLGTRVRIPSPRGRLRHVAAGLVTCILIFAAAVAGWRAINQAPDKGAEPATPTAPPAVTDPFTIQVAAYLRAEDAIRFTERLRQNGLEAYHSVATSANRKWYQVKVSHFATRSQARDYGEQLKAKGLIDDFYVANYQPGDISSSP